MSLLKTKPHWAPNAVATISGWANPVTGEILVSIGNLKAKLEAEKNALVVEEPQEIIPEPAPQIKKEAKMQEVKLTKEEKKKLAEDKKIALSQSQQILGEVVDIQLTTEQKSITE